MEIFIVNEYSESIINQVYDIHKNKLGEGYLSRSHFVGLVNKKQLIIAKNENEVLGFLKYKICTEKEFFEIEKLPPVISDKKVLALFTIAVKYENQKIGQKIINFCLNNFSKNINKIYAPVWTSKNGTNAKKLLLKFGINKIQSFPNYWYNDSLNVENFCPICNNPCTCALDIYCKDITE